MLATDEHWHLNANTCIVAAILFSGHPYIGTHSSASHNIAPLNIHLYLISQVLCHHVSRPDGGIFHNASQCVIQLASLNGAVFSSAEDERLFVSSVVKYLITFVSTM